MDDGVGVTENDEAEIETDEENENDVVDVNTPVLTEVVAELNAPVVEMVAEGVGVITDDEELPPPKSIKRNSYNQMCLYKGHLP